MASEPPDTRSVPLAGTTVTEGGLTRYVTVILEHFGLSPENAAIGAKVLVDADMRGTQTHGVRYLKTYLPLFRGGAMRPDAELTIVQDRQGAIVVDANAGMGHVMAYKATTLAIERVRRGPARMVTVLVRNSNHFGAAGYFSHMLAEAGMIGLVLTNSAPVMAAPGARGRVITNAPFSYGIPAPDGRHVVFDAALSGVAGTKVMMAEERGEPIPEGWMVDGEGEPTTDPSDYWRGGALLPIGGHKGYAIALLVEILSGVLSGAGITHEVLKYRDHPESPSQTGHAIIALDVSAFMPPVEFGLRLDQLRDELHQTPVAAGAPSVMLPGEPQGNHQRAARRDGLALAPQVWSALASVAEEFGEENVLQDAVLG